MPRKWIGAAAWSAKEAKVGDRLPYARLIDENTVLLRDGSVMSAIQVPGLLFETEDSDALNAHAATREVMLRSTLDARFVLYHHVVRRRVHVELDAQFDDPIAAHIDARWRDKLAGGALFVNDQFVTLDRLLDELVITGTVNEVVDKILALREKVGPFGEIVYAGMDLVDPALGRRSMELMANEVMPRVNQALGLGSAINVDAPLEAATA